MRGKDRKAPRNKETEADRLVSLAKEPSPENKADDALAKQVMELEKRILRERFWWVSGALFLFCFHIPISIHKTGSWAGWVLFFPVLMICWSMCAYYCGMPRAAEIISKQGHRISSFLMKFRN